MKGNTLQAFIAWLLVCALFTPTFLAIVDGKEDQIALMSLIEEEPGKEDKKEVQEMDVYFEWTAYSSQSGETAERQQYFIYILRSSDYLHKIILPPPEPLS